MVPNAANPIAMGKAIEFECPFFPFPFASNAGFLLRFRKLTVYGDAKLTTPAKLREQSKLIPA